MCPVELCKARKCLQGTSTSWTLVVMVLSGSTGPGQQKFVFHQHGIGIIGIEMARTIVSSGVCFHFLEHRPITWDDFVIEWANALVPPTPFSAAHVVKMQILDPACTNIPIYIYVWNTYIHACMHTYIHTYTHTYIIIYTYAECNEYLPTFGLLCL